MISIGHKDPEWVKGALTQYQSRLHAPHQLQYITCPASKSANKMAQENQALRKAVPKQAYCIALDPAGKMYDSITFSKILAQLQQRQHHIAFMIGGAEGLDDTSRQSCQAIWSLSSLTFPHKLVTVILAEQLYRASCIMHNHPYHK